MPEEIPPLLLHQLRQTLQRCDALESDAALKAVFVDARLAPWRARVPQARTLQARINALIEALHDQRDAQERSALALFLHVLRDETPPDDDIHRELGQLAAALGGGAPLDPAPSPGPHGPPSPPKMPAPLPPAQGSPFVVGRPLRASEPIFGRAAAFAFIAEELAKFSSVNLVAERRMGKTSVLHHLVGKPATYLPAQPDHPPLALACVDLQAEVADAARFYGLALRELLDNLPASRSAEAGQFEAQRAQLHQRPEASYDRFEGTLKRLRDPRGLCVRPVLIVDEFERLLEPGAHEGFPYPDFFNGLRALLTAELLALVVASRRPLAEYFLDPARPDVLTSSFPNYLTPYPLALLDVAAADALLLQASPRSLSVTMAAQARRWAGGHPCHLQAAGQAWYEAQGRQAAARWARERFDGLRAQSCMVSPRAGRRRRGGGLRALLRALVAFPMRVGRLAQHLGARLDDVAAWLIGAALLLLLLLLLLGVAGPRDVLDALKKAVGL